MGSLQDSTAITRIDETLTAEIDAAWDIWSPCGGYVAGIAVRAAGVCAPEGHRPVSISCQYLSRASHGHVDVVVNELKNGSSACFNVSLRQNESTFLQAQVWTTSKTTGPHKIEQAMPDVPPPLELEPIETMFERHGHKAIPFWQNMDGRPVDFRAPGDPDPRGGRMERWLNFANWQTTDDPFIDATRALVTIDTHIWAAYTNGLSTQADYIAPSLDLTVWFHDQAGSEEWLLADATADVAANALIHGRVRVWAADGRLVATGGSQCLVVPLKRQ